MYYLFVINMPPSTPFIGGDKVLSDVNEGKRSLDRHEHVVSDMVSPLYWFFFYDSGKQIVYDVRHVAQGNPADN
jgi:hypothetical protein